MTLAMALRSIAHIDIVTLRHWSCWKPVTVERPRHHGPVSSLRPLPPMRASARACRKDARRWKRRRFVQKLRRALA